MVHVYEVLVEDNDRISYIFSIMAADDLATKGTK